MVIIWLMMVNNNLVGGWALPLWKIWVRQWEGLSHILWTINNVWNHQSVSFFRVCLNMVETRQLDYWIHGGHSPYMSIYWVFSIAMWGYQMAITAFTPIAPPWFLLISPILADHLPELRIPEFRNIQRPAILGKAVPPSYVSWFVNLCKPHALLIYIYIYTYTIKPSQPTCESS